MEATVTLDYTDQKTAEAIAEAISPENFKAPIDLEVKTTRERRKVITSIRCEGKLATFIATIDDLLFSASTAEKTISIIRKMK